MKLFKSARRVLQGTEDRNWRSEERWWEVGMVCQGYGYRGGGSCCLERCLDEWGPDDRGR